MDGTGEYGEHGPLTAGTDDPTPTFAVPDALDATTTYEYLLTARRRMQSPLRLR